MLHQSSNIQNEESYCKIACEGNRGQICGGNDAYSIFEHDPILI
jgi:hypothetical protein